MSSVATLWPDSWTEVFAMGGLSLGLDGDARKTSSYPITALVRFAVVGAAGGVLGACYNAVVIRLIKLRMRLMPRLRTGSARVADGATAGPVRKFMLRHAWSRGAWSRMGEAAAVSVAVFSVFYWVPFLLPCTSCEPHMSCYRGNSSATSSGTAATTHIHADAHYTAVHLVYLQYGCHDGSYSQSASLLHTGQEGLLMHLLERTGSVKMGVFELGIVFALYYTLALLTFGISVAGGNFIPGMTIGAMLGRMAGEFLYSEGLIEATDVGMYALVGSAAVLNGISRMTLTISVILIEVSKDVGSLLPIVVTVTASNLVSSMIYISFDEAMIELRKANFLAEAPPPEFENLLTVSVMSSPVVCIREIEKVSNILSVLATTQHNGFPVLSTDNGEKRFAGLILRRQLLVVLEARVWVEQQKNLEIPKATREKFVGSFFSRLTVNNISLSTKDLSAICDLRAFVDPSPYVVSDLMPMRRVYRLFNEIGVRHLPVIGPDQRVVGMITRKDVLPSAMKYKASVLELAGGSLQRNSVAAMQSVARSCQQRYAVWQRARVPRAPEPPPPARKSGKRFGDGVRSESMESRRSSLAPDGDAGAGVLLPTDAISSATPARLTEEALAQFQC